MGYKGVFINSMACPGGKALTAYLDPSQLGVFVNEANQSTFPQVPIVARFMKAYQQRWHEAVTETSPQAGYEGIKWFARAVQDAGTTTDALKIHAAFKEALPQLGDDNLMGFTDYDPATGQVQIKVMVGVTQPDGTRLQAS
jgi:hypothetical protein